MSRLKYAAMLAMFGGIPNPPEPKQPKPLDDAARERIEAAQRKRDRKAAKRVKP